MIIIKITKTSISLSGHSNFAKKGSDIVCAGVSAIFFGSLLSWFNKKDIKIHRSNKNNRIDLVLVNNNKFNLIKIALMVKQLKQLAKNYKNFIKINNMGE